MKKILIISGIVVVIAVIIYVIIRMNKKHETPYDVKYVSPRVEDNKVKDTSIMEVRFVTDHAKVKIGDMLRLVGTNYDGNYQVIDIWGVPGDVKTAMVSRTTAMTVAEEQTPGAKAYISQS